MSLSAVYPQLYECISAKKFVSSSHDNSNWLWFSPSSALLVLSPVCLATTSQPNQRLSDWALLLIYWSRSLTHGAAVAPHNCHVTSQSYRLGRIFRSLPNQADYNWGFPTKDTMQIVNRTSIHPQDSPFILDGMAMDRCWLPIRFHSLRTSDTP